MMGKAADLKILIDAWIAEKPTRSMQTVAQKSDVKYNTIRRICIGESEPECYTALSLLQIIATPEQAAQYLEKHFPKALGVFGKFADSKIASFSPDMNSIVKDKIRHLILSFAYAEFASKSLITKIFGEFALVAAEKLCSDGLVYWEGDELKPTDGKEFTLYEGKQAVLDGCINILELSRMEICSSSPVAIIANVHPEEKEQINDIFRTAIAAISSIVKDSRNGKELVAAAICVGALTKVEV